MTAHESWVKYPGLGGQQAYKDVVASLPQGLTQALQGGPTALRKGEWCVDQAGGDDAVYLIGRHGAGGTVACSKHRVDTKTGRLSKEGHSIEWKLATALPPGARVSPPV